MKINFGQWCFSPRIITSLLTLLLFGLFVFLGCWQLDRAEQKRNLHVEFENRQSGNVLDLNQNNNDLLDTESLLWRPVIVKGKFLESFQILLDNQIQNTKAGYYVYTAFSLIDSKHSVLINRGWLAANPDRKISPELNMVEGFVSIKAVIKEIPKTGLVLKDLPPEIMGKGIFRVQKVDLDELADLTNTKLLPYIARLSSESEHGYHRQWSTPGSGENVHNGYAFQWFAFAAALLVIYLLLNINEKRIRAEKYG